MSESFLKGRSSFFRTRPFAALLIVGGLFIVWGVIFIARTSFVIEGQRYFALFDDSMITLRYAARLVEGRSLTWNDGLPIEGFTNFLMMLIMALAVALFGRLPAIPILQAMGLGWMLLSAGLAAALSRRLLMDLRPIQRDWGAVGVFAMTVAYYPLAYFSLMGVEVGLLTSLVLASLFIALTPVPTPAHTRVLALLIGLCFWTRPDGLVLALPIGLYHVWHSRPLRRLLLEAGAFLGLLIGGLTLFRLWSFGSPVPNTYLLKVVGVPLMRRVQDGIGYLLPFMLTIAAPLAYICLNVLRRPTLPVLLCLVLVIATLGYQVWAGGDVWPYWRLLAPAMPIFFVLLAWSLQRLWRIAIPVLAAFLLFMNAAFLPEWTHQALPYQAKSNARLVQMALTLNDVLLPDATLAVASGGILPYYAPQFRVIDCLGKSDPYIARLPPDLSGAVSWHGMLSVPGHNKYDLHYCVIEQGADYAEYLTWGREDLRASQPHFRLFEAGDVGLWLNTHSDRIRWARVRAVE